MENNFKVDYRLCAAVFHQWLYEYCPLKRQMSQIGQIIVQRCQLLAAPRWPNDISSAADNAIFKNRAQNIECSFDCVARSAVLLKPNVANILLLNFCEQKSASAFQWIHAGFLCPKCDKFACLHTRQDQNLKR